MTAMPSPRHVFYRTAGQTLPVAAGGDGIYIFDEEGRRYLDASGGAAVSCLGHSDPEVIAAMHKQIDEMCYAHTSFFTSGPAEALADMLVAAAPGDLSRVYFGSGGSEAMEAALKMARQYFVERGAPERRFFVARRQGYHGNTLGALGVGGNLARRAPFAPILADNVRHVSPCFAYRYRREDETEEQMGQRLADEFEAQLVEIGPEKVIAFLAETVVGATAGAVPPVPGYFIKIREICDRYGVLLILDEVMCGMGRTGTLFAFEQEGIVPDMVVIAKGLAAGYQPIGAVLVTEAIHDAFRAGSGAFQHGHTFMGHSLACAAGLAVQRRLQSPGMLEGVRRLGSHLRNRLCDRFGHNRHVGDIRGRGLFLALEFVADRATKEPFPPGLRLHKRIKDRAMRNGLICYPAAGTADGVGGDHVLLAPPFIISEAEIDVLVERLGTVVDQVLAEVAA